jgi:hypothetical protein
MDRRQTTADPRIEDFSGKTDTSLVQSSIYSIVDSCP